MSNHIQRQQHLLWPATPLRREERARFRVQRPAQHRGDAIRGADLRVEPLTPAVVDVRRGGRQGGGIGFARLEDEAAGGFEETFTVGNAR